ncbi:MAG: FecR domain-containing protein [Gemmatimonadaceae bacterium]
MSDETGRPNSGDDSDNSNDGDDSGVPIRLPGGMEWRLLDRYLAGECDPAEEADVRHWLDADPARRQAVEALRPRASAGGAIAWSAEEAWATLSARISAHDAAHDAARGTPAPAQRARAVARRRWLPLPTSPALCAAAAVLLVATSALVWRASDRARTESESPAAASREVATRRGEHTTLRLSDGTEVTLAADSKLRFPQQFGGGARDVSLTGEAYFRVTHDPGRPFLVHAGGAVTRVLGTEFGVRAYPGTADVRVVVAEGKVSLRSARPGAPSGAVLTRGDLGLLTPSGEATVRSGVDLDRYLAFASGRVTLENAPLRDALAELAHWYDVDFRVADSTLAGRRVTATFRGEPLAQVLDVLALALDARWARDGRTVTFQARRDAR